MEARLTLERAWVRWLRLERPLAIPNGLRVVTVGGATLGGSGKTPLARACAEYLASRGARVALVGHAYRAKPGAARVVRADDDPREVGDEAVECARALPASIPVVVAPSRQEALDAASLQADVVVIDGVLQTSPRRATLALLAVADDHAPSDRLRRAVDAIVRVEPLSRGAFVNGALVPWAELARARVALVTTIAKPERMMALLRAHDVEPKVVVTFADHARPRLPPRRSWDVLLVPGKTAAWWPEHTAECARIECALEAPGALRSYFEKVV